MVPLQNAMNILYYYFIIVINNKFILNSSEQCVSFCFLQHLTDMSCRNKNEYLYKELLLVDAVEVIAFGVSENSYHLFLSLTHTNTHTPLCRSSHTGPISNINNDNS